MNLNRKADLGHSMLSGTGIALALFVFTGNGDTPGAWVLAWLLLAEIIYTTVIAIRLAKAEIAKDAER